MAKIRISSHVPGDVPPPPPGQITIFADSTDNNVPKYKTSDGILHPFGGESAAGEYRNSVLSVHADPSTLTPSVGDKYLIADGAVGDWDDKDGQIAEKGTFDWAYTTPSDGWTVKADDEDTILYHHEGDYVAGVFSWDEQPFTNDLLELPTDGNWDDGLFDFEGSLIIDAIDDLNEFAGALAPPKAPDLSDWSENILSQKASGKLSFDTANPIGGYAPADAVGIPSPVEVDEEFNVNGKRLGITSLTGGDVSGILNDQVIADTGVPNPAYPADSFGDAGKGELRIILNGVTVSTINLTVLTANDTTSGGTASGLDISAAFPSLFPQGAPMVLFQNRTGTWLVLNSDLQNGYNSIIVEHEVSPTETRTLDRYEVIVDDDTTATAFTNELLDVLNMTGSKKLSGIDYHTSGTAEYDVDIDNAYLNTYSKDADAITHQGTKCSASQQALADCLGDEAKQVNIVDKTVTITPSGIRILNSLIDLKTTIKRTVQATLQAGLSTINNILLDNVSDTSNQTSEDFNAEQYRLPSDTDFDNFAGFSTGSWDGEMSLKIADGNTGYDDGLQIMDGKLMYPGNGAVSDFQTSNIINGSTWNDGGTKGGARDYGSETNDRIYYRFLRQTSPTVANFVLNIVGSGGTFVPVTTALTGNNMHVEMRAPTQTGWMDCYQDFVTGQYGDGDGCRNSTAGAGRVFGTNWGLTIGTKSTASTGGYMVIKISVGDSFTGEFESFTFNFG